MSSHEQETIELISRKFIELAALQSRAVMDETHVRRHDGQVPSVAFYDRYLEVLKTSLGAVMLCLQDHAAHASRDRNRLLPINRLPAEVLVAIFEGYSHPRWSGPEILTTVCYSWRDLVQNTPRLWQLVAGRYGTRIVHKALKFSKGHSLLIHSEQRSRDMPVDSFMDATVPEISRWREARLSVMTFPLNLEPLFLPAPALEVFSLRLWPATRAHPNANAIQAGQLFNNNAPQLHELYLLNVDLSWTCSILQGLRVLHLTHAHPQPLSFFTIMDTLRNNPRLESLELKRIRLSENMDSLTTPDKVDLPHLKSLSLSWIETDLLLAMLSRLSIPSTCTALHIECDIDEVPLFTALTQAVSHLIPPVTRPLGELGSTDVAWESFYLKVETTYESVDGLHRCITLKVKGLEDIMSEIVNEFFVALHHVLSKLPFRLIFRGIRRSMPAINFGAIATLPIQDMEITLVPWATDLCIFMSKPSVPLSTARVDYYDDPSLPWPCPMLHSIYLELDHFGPAEEAILVTLVRNRYSIIRSGFDLAEQASLWPRNLPRMFKSFRINHKGISNAGYEKLKSIIGDGFETLEDDEDGDEDEDEDE